MSKGDREYCIIMSKEDADIVDARSDAAGVTCDLEYLNDKVVEMIRSWGDEVDTPSWL